MSTSILQAHRQKTYRVRHREFLLAAIKRMRVDGLTSVNLTALASESAYSKGTWYNHFKSAEALYVEIAVVNAELLHSYVADIRDDPTLKSHERLASVFICAVAHAMTHPEIWMLGINARIWDKHSHTSLTEPVERLTQWERASYELILQFAVEAQVDGSRTADETTEALDIVRAAADGLGVLTTATAEHRWTREVTNHQTGTLLKSALAAGGFQTPTQPEMDRLCTQSWERISRHSESWLVPR
ncbi:TetR/AcrR family transcriptional regulator [Auritidibacter sp. NML100628]|uniref:TetR/AcrR family transcriptional regulator n=1 Tax=Auritidibacter sp. NML100628 TaxID=2170742 RepID=UPI000D73344B|nr:TetR/AcrR family transcriptional regulator [Auritidibacter sp. NML100628]PXA77081.1 hypothetical protein DCC24_05675 [Auritidibacter sp. NML100628]